MKIRLLKADEIECRIGAIKDTGMSLLLYNDARIDMKILDETFGIDGWQREHKIVGDKMFCCVSIWSEKRNEWIKKEDLGLESFAGSSKGEASDSFKRACYNVGIARELYTAPFIWLSSKLGYDKNEKFSVKEVEYNENREISKLVILDSKGKECYTYNEKIANNKKAKGTNNNKTSNEVDTTKVDKENTTKVDKVENKKGENSDSLLIKLYEIAKTKGYSEELVNKNIANNGCDINNLSSKEFEFFYKGFAKLKDRVVVGANS